ncbi:BppU family phage baseplate upper protein [Mammaliicoccus sp. J-M40]|uniref:BppU family phage baseplate upper protein n=1 Tax=Mammaliicoccus sp. J-M40 TaxID=2898699 RepID=UPI001EFBFA3E|nr:BppU family phage baseplate upper protein [Mammaliicoccus sp. J-M40]
MYNKEGRIKLETTAHIQNRLDTNIQFYNTDIGTADLVFNITRNGSPLLVSSENADVFLILKNGKNYIVDDVEPTDPMNGRLKYTIPNEFLGLTGKVNGQLYIAVHGKEDIVTEVEFSFKIADSLINTIPAVDKINEIRTFQEFRENIMTTINEINESLANGKDYVSQMEGTKASGMKALNDRNREVISQLENNAIAYGQALADAKDGAVSEIDDKGNSIKQEIEEMNIFASDNWQKYRVTDENGTIDILKNFDFNIDADLIGSKSFYVTNSVNGPSNLTPNGFVTLLDRTKANKKIIFQPYNSSRIFIRTKNSTWSDWQEIATERGFNRRIALGALDDEASEYDNILDLPAGLYECVIPQDAFLYNAPLDPNGSRYIAEIDVTESMEGRKQIYIISNYNNVEYRATIHTDGDFRGWKKVQNEEEFNALFNDTGWIEWNTTNGATKRNSDNPFEIGNEYRIRTVNGVKIAHLRIHVNNVTTQTVIGRVPQDITNKYQEFLVRTPVTKNPATVRVDIDGSIKLFLNSNDLDNWKTSDYIRVETSWIIDE